MELLFIGSRGKQAQQQAFASLGGTGLQSWNLRFCSEARSTLIAFCPSPAHPALGRETKSSLSMHSKVATRVSVPMLLNNTFGSQTPNPTFVLR